MVQHNETTRQKQFIYTQKTQIHTQKLRLHSRPKFGAGVKKQTFTLRCAFISNLALKPLVRLKLFNLDHLWYSLTVTW